MIVYEELGLLITCCTYLGYMFHMVLQDYIFTLVTEMVVKNLPKCLCICSIMVLFMLVQVILDVGWKRGRWNVMQ